jgi:hypothetical protein
MHVENGWREEGDDVAGVLKREGQGPNDTTKKIVKPECSSLCQHSKYNCFISIIHVVG